MALGLAQGGVVAALGGAQAGVPEGGGTVRVALARGHAGGIAQVALRVDRPQRRGDVPVGERAHGGPLSRRRRCRRRERRGDRQAEEEGARAHGSIIPARRPSHAERRAWPPPRVGRRAANVTSVV